MLCKNIGKRIYLIKIFTTKLVTCELKNVMKILTEKNTIKDEE